MQRDGNGRQKWLWLGPNRTTVSKSSAGWSNAKFYQELGHPRNKRWHHEGTTSEALAEFMAGDSEPCEVCAQGLRRHAEQEYLLQNLVRGAMLDASEQATEHKLDIAVRGTGLLAHMGIELGDRTEEQEFKNKTSKEEDIDLHPQGGLLRLAAGRAASR